MPRGSQVYRLEVIETPPATQPGKSLVASARVYSDGPGNQPLRKPNRRTRSDSWQHDAWEFFDTVPEFRAACTWVGNQLSKAKLVIHENGKPSRNADALDALASLFGGEEGQAEMLRLLGINFTVAGEAFVIGEPGTEYDEWSVIASVEVSEQSNGTVKVEGETVAPGTLPIRLWKAHPRKREESDCPTRALLPILSESVRLTQVVAAMADSRLKGNGILFVPSELELPNMPVTEIDGDGDETISMTQSGPEGIAEGLTRRLIRVMSTAMQNRDSAAASSPLVVAAPGEFLEKVNWVDFWTGFDEHVQGLRDEVVRRIGTGMDMPPEALTGTADVNHWGAWAIEEAAIKIHTEPLLAIIVASLTTGYLQPYLRGMGVQNWADFTFEADTTRLRLRPNRSKEAVELFDRGELSGRAMLIENGFNPETDAPDEQERMFQFVRRMVDRSNAAPEQIAALMEIIGVKGIPKGNREIERARGALDQPGTRNHPVREAPNPEESEAEGAVQASARLHRPLVDQPLVVDGLVMAAEQMVYRALERAGNKIRAKVGTKVGASAAEAYLSVPTFDYAECEEFLVDGWTSIDRFDYPGVSTHQLREALHEYTLMLMRAQKPMTRASLAKHLMLELAEAA